MTKPKPTPFARLKKAHIALKKTWEKLRTAEAEYEEAWLGASVPERREVIGCSPDEMTPPVDVVFHRMRFNEV